MSDFYCNKCGRNPSTSSHAGCDYLAAPVQPVPSTTSTQPAAPSPAVPEPLRKATYRKTKRGIILVSDPDSCREQQWKFVPLNPTRKMMEGAFDNISLSDAHSPFGVEEHVWDFMLANAPEPPDEEAAAPPAPASRVPLSEEMIQQILFSVQINWAKSPPTHEFAPVFVRAIEAAHGIHPASEGGER